jgi:uncharacterized protein (DUF697 family)
MELAKERLNEANKIAQTYTMASLEAGLIPIPIVDLAAVLGIQLKMLHSLTKLYEIPFSANLGKSIIGTLIGSVVPTFATASVIGSITKFVPIGGSTTGMIAMSTFGSASTYALGKAFIEHFESGGTLLTFEPSKMKQYFKEKFEQKRHKIQPETSQSEESNPTISQSEPIP